MAARRPGAAGRNTDKTCNMTGLRYMRGLLTVIICASLFLLISGCATRSHVWELEDRVVLLAEENARLRRALDQMGGGMAQEDEFRRVAATHNAEMYEMRTEIQRLSGIVEEMEYRLERDVGGLKAGLKDKTDDYGDRLSRLESYVGIGAVERSDSREERQYPGRAELEQLNEQALYRVSKQMFDDGQHKGALEGFAIFLERFPRSNLADNALFWTGEVYFSEQWYERAIVEYQKVIDDYPQGNKVPAAYLKQGIAFSLLGENDNAVFILRELIRKFPDHNEAKIAEGRLANINR